MVRTMAILSQERTRTQRQIRNPRRNTGREREEADDADGQDEGSRAVVEGAGIPIDAIGRPRGANGRRPGFRAG